MKNWSPKLVLGHFPLLSETQKHILQLFVHSLDRCGFPCSKATLKNAIKSLTCTASPPSSCFIQKLVKELKLPIRKANNSLAVRDTKTSLEYMNLHLSWKRYLLYPFWIIRKWCLCKFQLKCLHGRGAVSAVAQPIHQRCQSNEDQIWSGSPCLVDNWWTFLSCKSDHFLDSCLPWHCFAVSSKPYDLPPTA